MEGFDTLQYVIGDLIYSVAYKFTWEASEEGLPPFATSNQNSLDSLQETMSLEQLTTSSIILALIAMFVLGLTTYLVKKKSVNKFISYIPPVLIGILLIAFIARWKLFETVPYGIESYILFGLLVIGLAMLTWLGVIVSRKDKDVENVSLFWPFIIIGLYGTVVYDIGMYTQGGISLITNLPMAILYGFKIFLLDSDVSEIHEPFHASWLYSANFALVHFLAAGLSMLFVVKHFGFNIIQHLRMWWVAISPLSFKRKETFLFWGYNDATKDLAQSIQKNPDKNPKEYRIIIVRTDKDETDTPESKTAFSRIFNFISMRNSEIDSLRELDCLTVGAYDRLKRDDDIDSSTYKNILKDKLNLKALSRILLRKTTHKIHILFLLDNEKENIRWMNTLMRDSTIEEFSKGEPSRKIKFYCHARYNSVHRVVEDLNATAKIRVKVIDSSHLNVEMLKQTDEILPANFVEVQKDGRVSSAFNALVVGFSEVGQDSVKFIYEYGAFVDYNSPEGEVRRSKFHMDVVDNHMNDLAGAFLAGSPAISPIIINGSEDDKDEALITLRNMDCNSASFYEMVINKIRLLNYVVIATENDELNISLGVRIFRLAMRYRDNLNNLCILVRAHRDDDHHLLKITQYYNRLYLALGKDFNTKLKVQKEVLRSKKPKLPLHLFGLDKDVYTYANIISDQIENEAAKYKEEYNIASGDTKKVATDPDKMAWNVDFIELMQLDDEHKDYSPTYCGIMRLRRTRGQDIANYLHGATKIKIFKKAKQAAEQANAPCDFDFEEYSRVPKQLTYLKNGTPVNDHVTEILNVLAQMEHIRWNAAHEILGYIRGGDVPDKDEVKLTHSCLRNYEEFDIDDIEHIKALSYDYSIVDLTFGVQRSKQSENTND